METNSKYFTLKNPLNIIGESKFINYTGWSGLNLVKFILKKNDTINFSMLNEIFPDLSNKEKIFFTTVGNINFDYSKKNINLNKFDAIDLNSAKDYSFNSSENTTLFMISSNKSKTSDNRSFCFNFKKDIEARNLWGGKIISRPYEGQDLTIVLFELKPGFKFEDKGHQNEQITWLTEGEMDFYSDGIKKNLKTDMGVSIGPNHIHGGLSNGAIGFDAFFPKRVEKKYKR